MGCKAKKKDKKAQQTSKTKTSKKSTDSKSVSTAASPASTASRAPSIAPTTQPAKKRPVQYQRKARRNYFKGDDRYRTTVAAGLTTIAGGGGAVPTKDDRQQTAKIEQWIENWYITETELVQDGSLEGDLVLPAEAALKKGAAAQKRLMELEKKFGLMLLTALQKGEVKSKDNKTAIEDLPAEKESPANLDDPRYEIRWW